MECKSQRSLEYQSRRTWPREDEVSRRVDSNRKKPQLKHPPNLCAWLKQRDLEVAKLRLLRQSFVGVVELYDESLCLLKYKETGRLPRNCRCEHFQKNSHHLTKRTAPHALTDIAPETLALMRKYLVAHDTPLYNLARDRLLKEIKTVERATGARLGKTCGIDGDDDDGDDDATLVRARPGGK